MHKQKYKLDEENLTCKKVMTFIRWKKCYGVSTKAVPG